MKKLSIDNPFFNFMGNLGDWMILNVLFVITSLPIVTIGMSLTALYQVTLRRTRGESVYVVREYIQACREEWKKSTKVWLVLLATGFLLLFDILYTLNLWPALSMGIGVLLAIWCFLFTYAFPLQAQFDNTVKDTLKNALLLSVQQLPFTILMIALNAIPIICIAGGAYVTMMAMPVYLVIGFSLTARVNSIFLTKIFNGMKRRICYEDSAQS
ncbi:MAG: YesL family protein [Lachnospiraceae bacterium]|nr:YesL family protein [Lachnospiraceae bacterium]